MLGPVFIVGSPRSGTSILTEALQFAGYAGYNEGNFLSLLHTLNQDIERHYQHFGSDMPEILTAHIDKNLLKSRIFGVVRDLVQSRLFGHQWLDKTGNPEMISVIPIIRRLWPTGVFIFAKRRGLENIVSRLKKFPQYDFAYHCADWARNMTVWRELRAMAPDLPCIEIDQWDIAHAPEATAAELAQFLNLRLEQQKIIHNLFETSRPQETSAGSAEQVLTLETTGWNARQQETYHRLCGPNMQAFHYTEDTNYRLPPARDEVKAQQSAVSAVK